MSDPEGAEVPESFTELTRNALLHLHEAAFLQTHPLSRYVVRDDAHAGVRGRMLYRALLEAIETVRPEPNTDTTSRAWRAYRILELRYLDGLEAGLVADRIALSKNQYNRDHARALEAVASVLWHRWHATAASEPESGDASLSNLEAAQLAADSVSVHLETVDLVEVVQNVITLLQSLCHQRGVKIALQAVLGLPSLRCDRVALRQALVAVLARCVGAPVAGHTVELSLSADSHRVLVTASVPTGSRIDVSESALTVAMPFVTQLRGRLTAGPSAGTADRLEIRLLLPIGSGSRLLAVDNNADFLRLIDRYLAGSSWEVHSAADVEQARALVRQERYDAAILDIVLPDRDGWDFLVSLKADPATSGMPVLICSVLREPEVALSLGAVAYLQKPITRQRLLEALSPYRRSANHP